MVDPVTVNVGLAIQARGSNVGVWDGPLNADFVALDGFFGGVQTIAVAGSPITLTSPAGFTPTPGGGPTQAQNAILRVTGAPSTNIVITLPLPGYYIVENLTTVLHFLQFRAVGSGEIIAIDQGAAQHIYNDGTNVRFADLPPVGSYLDTCETSVPIWIQGCTKPPYLICDGSTFSAVTYPYLNAKLGGNVLPDLRGRSRFALNGGTNRVTTAISGVNGDTVLSSGGDQALQIHAHGVVGNTGNDTPDHTHLYGPGAFVTASGSSGQDRWSGGGAFGFGTSGASTRHSHPINLTSQNGGSGNSQNMPPATISGIMLIRAG